MFKIDKAVPLNGAGVKDKRIRWAMPLAEMEVGDSFLVPTIKGIEPQKFRSRVSVAMTRQSKALKGKFTSRMMKDGVRVWRIA